MSKGFKRIDPSEITDNTFKLIGTDWMLVTAGTKEEFNTMTASWGGFGILWDKKVCFSVIRPQRHTYGFMNSARHFTLSFFDESYRDTLIFCGTNSGRDVDKVGETGLTPLKGDGTIYFAEARLVLELKKIYYQDIDPANFMDPDIEGNYPEKDYHRMFFGEVTACLIKET